MNLIKKICRVADVLAFISRGHAKKNIKIFVSKIPQFIRYNNQKSRDEKVGEREFITVEKTFVAQFQGRYDQQRHK
jgi:hypothetical protein